MTVIATGVTDGNHWRESWLIDRRALAPHPFSHIGRYAMRKAHNG